MAGPTPTIPPVDDALAELQAALALEDETERMLSVAAIVAKALRDLGFEPVVVGGLAVQLWTDGAYTTFDIDVLLPADDQVSDRLSRLGFLREGRHWILPGRDVLLEAPGNFLAPSERATEVRLPNGSTVSVLSVEDVLIYRLHEFAGTGHRDAASQAVSLLAVPELDDVRLAQRAAEEGLTEALAAISGVAERIDAGETIETDELHDIARGLGGRKLD
jgi:hypothetical protein